MGRGSRGRLQRSIRMAALLSCLLLASACAEQEPGLDEIRALQANGMWEESTEALRGRIDAGDRDPEVLLLYGTALMKSGMHSLALWPLLEAAESDEWFVQAMLQLAGGAYMTGNHDLAIERLNELLEREPDNIKALRLRGFARLHTRRDYEGALEDFEHMLDLEPEKKEMMAPKIVALLGLREIEEARAAIEEFAELEIVPENEESETPMDIRALACVGRAKFTEEDGDLEKAREHFLECVEAFPSQSMVVHEAMEFFKAQGDIEKFDEILRGAYEAAPQDRTYRVALARRYQLLENNDEAQKILEAGADAGYPGAMIDLAGFLVDIGDLESGIEIYRKAKELGASSPTFILTFGEALISGGHYDEALELTEGPGPESHKVFIRGRVALEKKDYSDALEHFTQGVLLWPDNAVARYYTALAAEQVGEVDRAIEEYRNALRIDATAADSRLRLGRLHLAEGNANAALYILRYQSSQAQPIRDNLEAVLLELEALALSGQTEMLPAELVSRVTYPTVWGASIAAIARGIERRDGVAEAVGMIRSADRLDLAAVNATEALESLVVGLVELGETDSAIELARAAASKNPDHSPSIVVLGDTFRLAGRLREADESYKRALEIDAESSGGLLGLAEVALAASKSDDALGFLDRIPKDAYTAEISRTRANALRGLGRTDEAVSELIEALGREPYDGEIALALAELRLARGDDRSSVEPLIRRAVRLGGGEAARELLEEGRVAEAD